MKPPLHAAAAHRSLTGESEGLRPTEMRDILKGKAIFIGHVKHSLRQKVIAKMDRLNNIQTVVAGRKSGSS